jgi:hypothetical protein
MIHFPISTAQKRCLIKVIANSYSDSELGLEYHIKERNIDNQLEEYSQHQSAQKRFVRKTPILKGIPPRTNCHNTHLAETENCKSNCLPMLMFV